MRGPPWCQEHNRGAHDEEPAMYQHYDRCTAISAPEPLAVLELAPKVGELLRSSPPCMLTLMPVRPSHYIIWSYFFLRNSVP